MKLSEFNKQLLNKISKSKTDDNSHLWDEMNELDKLCSDRTKLYSRIDLPQDGQSPNISDLTDQILLSTILSDTTKICSNSNTGTYVKTEEFIKEEIDELLSYYDLIDNEREIITVSAGTFNFTKKEAKLLQKNFEPLIDAGRLTISPNWNLMIITGTMEDPTFCTVSADRDEKQKLWRAPLRGNNQTSIPISYSNNSDTKYNLVRDLTVPIISGLNVKDFTMVLEDESDLLSAFRKELKSFTQVMPSESQHQEQIYNDMIRPRIDKINQRFKSISNIHKLKVNGAVFVTSTLSMLSASIGQYMAAMTSIAAGTGTLIKFEADHQKNLSDLKEDPMYLLWRLSKLKR